MVRTYRQNNSSIGIGTRFFDQVDKDSFQQKPSPETNRVSLEYKMTQTSILDDPSSSTTTAAATAAAIAASQVLNAMGLCHNCRKLFEESRRRLESKEDDAIFNEDHRTNHDMSKGVRELSGTLEKLHNASVENNTSKREVTSGRKTWSAPNPDPFFNGQREYNPSVFEDTPKGKRGDYLRDLEKQMEEKRNAQEHDRLDWWEKRSTSEDRQLRQHPSQTTSQRPDMSNARKTYERELKEQMEEKRRQEEARKRLEREEEEKIERRIREQQERMKKEYEEEINKKRAKEDAKLRRQEEMQKKQEELRKEAEVRRREAAERRFQERKAAREEAAKASHIVHSTEPSSFRSESPPIPALRGVVKVQPRSNNKKDSVQTRLNEMMDTLQQHESELDKDWIE